MAAKPGLDLKSPFLSNELFASEPDSGSEARAERLASQSPFLSALEPGLVALAGDPESIEQPGWGEEGAGGAETPIDEAKLDSVAIEHVAADAGSRPGSAVAIPAIKSPPSLQIVMPTQKPLPNSRWAVHQKDAIFEGALDREGWTGPIDRGSRKFDSSQPFRIHVEGCVCSIVSGAALLTNEPDVEYGGQFVDWNLADDPDFQKSSAFWREYEKARSLRAPLDVFRFLQHDHVMRRPVKLLARHTRAVFEARPLAIRLGPIVRYVDSRRALVWLELETPGLVRVTYGKATNQRERPKTGEVPTTQSQSHTTSVRVGGRHYALVWLDALDADAAYQYTIALAPLPPTGPLPIAQADFTETVFPRTQTFWSRSNTNSVLKTASFSDSEWIFFRTAPLRADALRFAHGSCRKWPGDDGPKNPVPGPDMLEAFSAHLLAKKNWAGWPQFFLHSGDQIYADDVGAAMSRAILRHRFASVPPGPGPVGANDVAFGAWAGRFGWRYSPRATGPAKPSPDDVDPKYLRSFFDYRGYDRSLVDGVIDTAIAARRFAAGARSMADATRPLRHKLRVMNELLWRVPVSDRDIPIVDKVRGLRTRAAYAIKHRNRAYQLEYPSAGDVDGTGVHAADYAEYAALYEQAWSQPGTRRLLAHLPSFMIFDDHEVTDDWNADPGWLKIVLSKADPLQCWPTTMTDALCAYWVYQGWGNLAPEQWASDPRVKLLERCRKQGRDALPELRRLVFSGAVPPTESGNATSNKLDWNFKLPTGSIPFLAVDLRTDREVIGKGGMSAKRLAWLEDALMKTKSPVAFVVLPVPYLLPDPALLVFRQPGAIGWLSGSRSTAAFKRGSDLEHPASNPVWDQIKNLLAKLQRSSALKTLVIVSGDIHFSCNLDGQLRDSLKAPRLLQLVSSGLQQKISEEKQGKLISAYRGWWNVVSGAQGVDEHRGMRITLGGLHGPGGKKCNFLFDTSVAVVDMKIVLSGNQKTRVPLIEQTHLVRGAQGALVPYAFRHMTQADGSAVMSLKDPGFRHPASPKDYPATSGGIGIAKEFDGGDEAFDSGADPLLFEDAQAPLDEVEEEAGDHSVGELDESSQVELADAIASEEESADQLDTDTSGQGEEAELESPKDFEDLYSRAYEHELDQGNELDEPKETEGFESYEEKLDWLTDDSGEEESEIDEEKPVEVELQAPKRGPKTSSLHSVKTTDIFMHVYFPKLATSYTGQQFFDWIVAQSPDEIGPNRFQIAGVEITLVNNSKTAVADFKGSLKGPGSVVVYFGHTVLGQKTTLGLAPNDPPAKKPGITCGELTNLLNAGKAKIVVLAGCATSQCVTKIKGDTAVIVTQSGKDRLTNTLQWAPAIKALLDELLAGGTVGDALAAANKSFAKISSTDSFKMINGDPTLKMI